MMIERHEQTSAAHHTQSGWTFWVWWIPISIVVGLVSTPLALIALIPFGGDPYYFEVRDCVAGFLSTVVLGICFPFFRPRPFQKTIGTLLGVWVVTAVGAILGWSGIVMREGPIPESPLLNRVGGWAAGWLIGSLILGVAWYWRQRATTPRK